MAYNTQNYWDFRLINYFKLQGSLYGGAYGDDALRFASHEERYMVECFGLLLYR
jgi:hypothetical protein